MARKTLSILTTAAALALSTAATAGTSPFSMVSGAFAPGIDVSLTVQASSQPGYDYDFVVNNAGSGTITGFYFERDWNSKIWGVGQSNGPASLNPASLDPAISGWEGSKSSHTVGQDATYRTLRGGIKIMTGTTDRIDDGLTTGNSQMFSFATDTDIVSLSDLEDMLGTEGFGVAIRVQDLSADKTASGWGLVDTMPEQIQERVEIQSQDSGDQDQRKVTGAPTPTAALAGLAMLGILGLRRRRA